ncbi:MAG: hypothetical protein F4Y05_01300 [Acidimicrobiaceae bacterium]|nr:hypothetical protein [Acidimicrobiaceae bacterium]MYE08223.1 hypothetical protein [Acidimicrobiaceae bacterium]MYI36016.1 hypothetical protein [Acidimicrobiaceae bacterium]
MSDEKIERMLHVVLQKQDKLQEGQSNLARLLAEILDHLGTVAPLDITGEGSPPPPPPIDPELLKGATSELRALGQANLQAIRKNRSAA